MVRDYFLFAPQRNVTLFWGFQLETKHCQNNDRGASKKNYKGLRSSKSFNTPNTLFLFLIGVTIDTTRGRKGIWVNTSLKLSCHSTPIHVHPLNVSVFVEEKCPFPRTPARPRVCALWCVFFEGWQGTSAISSPGALPAGGRAGPPSPKCYYSVMSPSSVRMLLHFHLLSQVECEWCSFSNIRSLELPAAALHKYTTPVSAYNSLQAWKNSDFLYWPDSFAIPNSCMFSPPRILIFKFPFVSALFQWIANKNDSHFYNPWEHGERAFQKNRFF